MRPIVTLLTDFGTIDGFVGAMKGVILSRAPEAQIIDLTHEIPPHDVRAGAWALREAASTFPRGTIHVAVIDPGVGTARRALLLGCDGHLFLGPDNGVLSYVASRGSQGWVLDRDGLFCSRVSSTFHGRDVFASVAGHLAAGMEPKSCGSPTQHWVTLEQPIASQQGRTVRGQVVHIDRFGNLVTNISENLLRSSTSWTVVLANTNIGPIRSTFADGEPGEWVSYMGSSGALEIAVCKGNASASGGIIDTEVVLCKD